MKFNKTSVFKAGCKEILTLAITKCNFTTWFVSGDQFMTYNVHQLLHLKSDVENLGPLWTHSCFFFEDLNGDFRDLFHGTQNINGQVRIH